MGAFRYFLQGSYFTISFGILLGIQYITVVGFFMYDSAFFKYGMLTLVGVNIIIVLSILFSYQGKKQGILTVIETKEFNKKQNQLRIKYKDILKKDIFSRINIFKNLIEKRFDSSSVFRYRLLSLLNKSLEAYINNLELISDINMINTEIKDKQSVLKKWTKKQTTYTQDLEEIEFENEKIIDNLDKFIKEIVMESRNESEINNLYKSFERNFETYQEVKKVRKGN